MQCNVFALVSIQFDYHLYVPYIPVLHRNRIMKLLTQHVAKGDFWVPTDGSPLWWGYRSVICIQDRIEIGCRFSPNLFYLMNPDCHLRGTFISRKNRGKFMCYIGVSLAVCYYQIDRATPHDFLCRYMHINVTSTNW